MSKTSKTSMRFGKKPTSGESFFVTSTENFKCAHCHALFLGSDNTEKEKVLLATFSEGWSIVDYEDIRDGLRNCGKFNIEDERCDNNGNPVEYVYAYYDDRERFLINVSKESGVWEITSDFKTPSWAE